MLKLLLNNNDCLDDIIITEDTILDIKLDNCNKRINIDVMENMCLEVYELDINTKNNITYNLHSNSLVIVNKLAKNNSDTTLVKISGDNANLKYYTSIMNYNDNVYNFKVIHKNNFTNSEVFNHCVNFTNSEFKFIVNSEVVKEAIECYCNQDNKIIDINNGKNFISPNLLIDNDLINANHSAYIGKFKKDVIFYLKSRGLNEKECDFLLIKGFLLGKMHLTDEKKEEYINYINTNFE